MLDKNTGELVLRIADGTPIVVPATLSSMTTYVLLEQENWFEKEATFVPLLLRRGMTAIDLGANLGVYAVPLARRLGPEGALYAYEPSAETRRFLHMSRELNRLAQLHIVPKALSDRPRDGLLSAKSSGELRMLTDDPEGEPVSISSLDEEDRAHHWPSPDFVKIDVEGEELRVIEGGRVFFARYSPLIMFEMKAGRQVNHAIAETFRALGYRIFRLLPGAPLLVPVEAGDVLDQSELNLFAAKPDRAAALAREGRLVEEVSAWHPDDAARAKALEAIAARPFGPSLSRLSAPPLRSDYRDALAGYATWASPDVPSSVRYAALRFSSNLLNDLCHSQPQLGRLSTFARASWALGERRLAIAALQKLLEIEEQTPCITEPFWPASRRFDSLNPGDDVPTWFLVSTAEQLERISGYSSVFPGSRVNLEWLRGQRLVSTEIERRYVLKKARVGERVAVPQRLCRQAEDHINFDTWRSGLVPNTFVAGA